MNGDETKATFDVVANLRAGNPGHAQYTLDAAADEIERLQKFEERALAIAATAESAGAEIARLRGELNDALGKLDFIWHGHPWGAETEHRNACVVCEIVSQ